MSTTDLITRTEFEYDEILDRLTRLERENLNLKYAMAAIEQNINIRMRDFINEIQSQVRELPHKVLFSEAFPPEYKMIRGQLFHNEPNPTGKRGGYHPSEWMLKVSFWTHSIDTVMYGDGTVQPFFFTMRSPVEVKPINPESLFAACLENGAELIGCRGIKGAKRAGGTRLIEDQAALIFPSANEGRYPARALVIASGQWNAGVTLTDPYITPVDARKKGAPVESWTKRVE